MDITDVHTRDLSVRWERQENELSSVWKKKNSKLYHRAVPTFPIFFAAPEDTLEPTGPTKMKGNAPWATQAGPYTVPHRISQSMFKIDPMDWMKLAIRSDEK